MGIEAQPQIIDEEIEDGEPVDDSLADDENTDLASGEDSEDNEDKVTFDEKQQVVFDREQGKKVQALRAAERRADAAEAELVELRANAPKVTRPNVPPMPDSFDDDFDTKMAIRDKSIADAAEFDAQEKHSQQREQENQQIQQNQQTQQLQTQATTYANRAVELGVSPAELQVAGPILAAAGISNDLTMHILTDESGPAITKHLADNPRMLDEIRDMTPLAAAAFIETNVKPNLSNKPVSKTPAPARNINGGGSPPSERGPKGAKFE